LSDVESRIEAILSAGHGDGIDRANALGALAIERRDADDLPGFEACKAAFPRIPGEAGGPAHGFMPSRAFRCMYPNRQGQRVLVMREKHGERHLAASTPDAFARAALSVLADRVQDGFWYDGGGPCAHGEEGVLARAYLDHLRQSPILMRGTPPDDRGIVRTWRGSDALAEVQAAVPTSDLRARLAQEAARETQDDHFVAFLALALLRRNVDGHGPDVATILARSPGGSLAARISGACPKPDAARARDVLRVAAGGDLRRAGRLAFAFLDGRRDHQYERIDLVDVETPRLDLGKLALDEAPQPNRSP